MGKAYHGWMHCTGSTYGTWPRGDDRGWRARHHREHVEGDYRTPPPVGKYEKELDQSRRAMKRERVVLSREQREMAVTVMAESLLADGCEVIDLCVGAKHWHGLARFDGGSAKMPKRPDDPPRFFFGRAKGRSARALSKSGLVVQGGVWAVRCRPLPIKDESHLKNVTRYIPQHARKGAAVYSLLVKKKTQG